jgi:hypothetical protein
MFDLPRALKTIFRILTFRAKPEELLENSIAILAVGLLITWLVGIGRWWDDPRDLMPFVRWGLGSVFYVFALSALLWVIAWPLLEDKVGYHHVAAFVASTSLPAVVYALPIEQWTDMSTASTYNVNALLFVSLYRVSLLGWFYVKILKLTIGEAIVVTGLPITAISLALTALGHGARVMDIMGGLRDRMSKSEMETIIGAIGCLSFILGPIFLVAYFTMWTLKRRGD